MTRRFRTAETDALVRELYPRLPAEEVARRVFGDPTALKAVYYRAKKLGLEKHPHWTPAQRNRVRAAIRGGGTDAAIARRLGLSREQVTHLRHRMGLPRDEAAILTARRNGVKSQWERLGVRHGGDLRALGYRKFAVANGWPDDLPPRAVQVLNVLAEHGPQTKRDLAARIGMPTDDIGCNGSLRLLAGSAHSKLMDGHGSYTGLLLDRGLVIRQRRFTTGRGKGRNRLPDLYILTPHAIAIRETILDAQERGTGAQTALPGSEPGGNGGRRPGAGGGRGVGGKAPRRRV